MYLTLKFFKCLHALVGSNPGKDFVSLFFSWLQYEHPSDGLLPCRGTAALVTVASSPTVKPRAIRKWPARGVRLARGDAPGEFSEPI